MIQELEVTPVKAGDLKIGEFVIFPDKAISKLIWVNLMKKARAAALLQAEFKDVEGAKRVITLRPDEILQKIYHEEKSYIYLYKDQDTVYLMAESDHDQITLPLSMLESHELLKDGMEVTVTLFGGKPKFMGLPRQIPVLVTETDPIIKNQTASGSRKPATVAGKFRINVPESIETGDEIILDTTTMTYVGKAPKK